MLNTLPLRVRAKRPMVYCITNYVTMDWVARGLLAAGARPVMALDVDEAAALGGVADAVTLNMGTWSPRTHEAMIAAGRAANRRGVPVVFDPVGIGGLESRTRSALDLLESVRVTAIRGNAGEIAALVGDTGLVRGVDSAHLSPSRMAEVARRAAARFGCIVAATGVVDVISDGKRAVEVHSGHRLMGEIPGAGCLGGALVAAALATATAADDLLNVVADLHLWAGVAGEEAAAWAKGPGTFPETYLDALASVRLLPEGRISAPLADRLSLYVIVSGTTPLSVLEAALTAGAGTIQFREKSMPLGEQMAVAVKMRELCRSHGALFLMNDRVDMALAVGADGVHLGQEDLPVEAARRLLGPEAIIGSSCATPEEARIALAQGADYLGTGPVYATPSKSDAGEPIGTGALADVCGATTLPVVGIGGIAIGNAAPVIKAGACGVSVISAVVGAPDPAAAARTLLAEVLMAKRF